MMYDIKLDISGSVWIYDVPANNIDEAMDKAIDILVNDNPDLSEFEISAVDAEEVDFDA